MATARRPRTFTIPLIYGCAASFYIVGSDVLVEHSFLTRQTAKGLAFVAITSVLLYVLIRRHELKLLTAQEHAESADHMRSLGELAARVSHDLSNVLMAWRTLLPVLEKKLDRREEALKVIEQLRRSEGEGAKLLTELLSFANPRPPVFARVQLQAWLESTARALELLLTPDVSIDVEVTPASLTIEADDFQLERVVRNLVLNAAEAMQGKGQIRIVACADENGSARISVQDCGSGIGDEVKEHVFEPLVTTKRKGTGLGLAIVKHVVAAHHGSVSFESAAGVGTVFHVRLPMKQ